jgi:hypothetical protein
MKPKGLDGLEGQAPKSATKLVFDAAAVVGLDRRARGRRGGSVDSAPITLGFSPEKKRDEASDRERRASADASVGSSAKISLDKYRQVRLGFNDPGLSIIYLEKLTTGCW